MTQKRSKTKARPRTSASEGIVSSSHLVSPRSVELSELEFGLIVAWNAFSRWAVRCMAAAGCPDLTVTDVLLLHHQVLSQMLGSGRSAVTIAAGALRGAGLIRYTRGKITILDREGLEASACECYGVVRAAFETAHLG